MFTHVYTGPLPNDYSSHVSRGKKIAVAYDIVDFIKSKGYSPVSASVMGSVLRGLDTPQSDIDVMVVVSDKCKNKMYHPHGMDVHMVSLPHFVDKLSTSVPYVEHILSPFRIVDENYAPYFASLVINPYVLEAHAKVYAHRNLVRATEEKGVRMLLGAWNVAVNHSVLATKDMREQSPEIVAQVRLWENGEE